MVRIIKGNERVIVIFGMAHSGTTILANTLSQCPNIHLVANGGEVWLLENDQLGYRRPEDASFIQSELAQTPKNHYLLFKRPWAEIDADFFRVYLPDAHYFCMLKSFADAVESWSKPTSLVTEEMRTDPSIQAEVYGNTLMLESLFALNVGTSHFQIIDYTLLLMNPQWVLNHICNDLRLSYQFDTSEISAHGDIKTKLHEMRSQPTPRLEITPPPPTFAPLPDPPPMPATLPLPPAPAMKKSFVEVLEQGKVKFVITKNLRQRRG